MIIMKQIEIRETVVKNTPIFPHHNSKEVWCLETVVEHPRHSDYVIQQQTGKKAGQRRTLKPTDKVYVNE